MKLWKLILPISTLLLIFLLSITISHNTSKIIPIRDLHVHKHIQVAQSACAGTLYPDLCVSTLSSPPQLTSKSLPQIISDTVNHTISEAKLTESNCTVIEKLRLKQKSLRPIEQRALDDCIELLESTVSELRSTLSHLSSKKTAARHAHDLQTLLSAAMTNQFTCLDGFSHSNGNVREAIKYNIYNISRHVSNSLAMLKKIPGVDKSEEAFPMKNGFPRWMPGKDRKLLQAAVNEPMYDLVVANDGTGNFTTISEAVAAAPNNSLTRFVIYIKAGAYFENVEVEKKKRNLMFVGDGIGKTVVKASRNVVDGWTTFRSATVAVVGNGFIAKGITIENSAGPSKHQAVALRSGADFSAFYQCSFVGYQDTLYTHSLRQFYRECDIYGTIDFIFGNAAVIFQNCNLYARKPNENQKNVYTAQGREDPNQNTGISLLNCKIAAASDLIPVKNQFKTYLGRPWKLYSRTVVIKSYIEDVVDSAGWLEWNGTDGLSTLYYGEYMNSGPGSNTMGRVNWPGFRVISSSIEASQFTVEPFIQGSEWLNSTTVPYFLGL